MEPSSWQIQNSAAPAWLRLRHVSAFFIEPQRPAGTIVKRVDPFVPDASGVLGVLVAFSAFPGVLARPSPSSPDSVIPEAKFLHGFRIEEVTTVEDDRSVHRLAHTLEIDPLKFVPLSCQNKCFGVLNRFKG